MKFNTASFALFLCALPAAAAQYSFDMQPATTKIQWTLADPLHTVRGTFNLKTGHIQFDPATGKASGKVVVDVASGASGSDARDRRMHANVLESAKYPEAILEPESIDGTLSTSATSNLKLQGTFTIHGAAHKITMDVKTTAEPGNVQALISFSVPYVAWGMKNPSNFLFKVGKTVEMSIETRGSLSTSKSSSGN